MITTLTSRFVLIYEIAVLHLLIHKVSNWNTVLKQSIQTVNQWEGQGVETGSLMMCEQSWCFCYRGFIMQIAGGWIPLAPAGGLRERMMNIHTPEDCLLSHDSSTHTCWSNTCRVFISLLYSQLLRSLRLKFSVYSMCLKYRDLQLACLLACLLACVR